MAQDAMNITTNGTTKDKLAESYGHLLDAIQKGAVSEQIKNKDYSGDPTTGSVKVDRFKNAASAAYGTARAAGKGSALVNSGKVTISLDTDKEIIEEFESKDVKTFGIDDLIARRVNNHAQRMIADLDSAFFTKAEAKATAASDVTDTDIQDVVHIPDTELLHHVLEEMEAMAPWGDEDRLVSDLTLVGRDEALVIVDGEHLLP